MNLIQYLKSKLSDYKPNKSFIFTLSNGKDVLIEFEKPHKSANSEFEKSHNFYIKSANSSKLDLDELEKIITCDDLNKIVKEIDKFS